MAILVRNELPNAWVFERSAGKRQIAAGATAVISDEEWASVITAKRGPGGLNPVSSDPGSRSKTKLDYILIGSTYEVLYMGFADQTAADADNTWTIKYFQYSTLGTDNKVVEVQVLDGVAWTNRGSLPWT